MLSAFLSRFASLALVFGLLGFAQLSIPVEAQAQTIGSSIILPSTPGFKYDFGCGTAFQKVPVPCKLPEYECGKKNVFEFAQKFKVKNCELGKALSEKFVKKYLEVFCALNTECCEEAGCEGPFCELAKFDAQCFAARTECESVLVIKFAIVYGCEGN